MEISIPKNEGWATFDTPQFTSSNAHVETHAAVPLSAESLQDRFDPFSTVNGNMQWPSFEISNVGVSSVTSDVWQDGVWNAVKQVPVAATDTQVSSEVWSIVGFAFLYSVRYKTIHKHKKWTVFFAFVPH